MEEEKYTNDQLYEIIEDPEKLKCYKKMNKVFGSMGADMQFIHDMPYDEIKQFIGEEKEAIFNSIPAQVISDSDVTWEHVGSTSIKGMPGTLFPDSLILYKKYPPPREVFNALMSAGFEFVGAGPLHSADLWFIKKIIREGTRIDGGLFKIHLTPADFGASRMLIETRDRCNNNPADFEDYKNSKVKAAEHLAAGNIMQYKIAKGSCKLLQELNEKYGGPAPPKN
ncbi:hypothetical protein ACHWQZ_G000315 [Mnemiopsis leidyi]